ncbi:MAG: hypothetical protein SGI74_04585 [Oligoflexia bacterium]|nr:hypothetical protein [Oligoflexia bacterium]
MSEEAVILIVDDEKELRESLGELLARKGFAVQCVQSGNEALQVFHERKKSLVGQKLN